MDADISQIDGEIIRLKNELSRTRNALSSQIVKRHQLVAELSLKVDEKTDQLKQFHRSNSDDLGRVLRSLYVFESRLRKEQQQIRRQLGERDSVIRQQQVEISKLRQTLASYCHKNNGAQPRVQHTEVSVSKPDLITCISPRSHGEPPATRNDHVVPADTSANNSEKPTVNTQPPPPPPPPPLPSSSSSSKQLADGTPRKNVLPVDTTWAKKNPNNNINFNKNVYTKTVTDLSLNDISSFPNPTPNNNLFVVSNSIFSKNEFTYNEVSKEVLKSVKQNGKVITSALKKADKYPLPKSVHFGKTTHIPEPGEDGQTDIVKTVETLLLQCGDSCTESENDTSSTASTETSPSVSQMVRKFESICTTTGGGADSKTSPTSAAACNGGGGGGAGNDGSYIADSELKTAAELDVGPDSEPDRGCGGGGTQVVPTCLSDLDPKNNFEEFRFEDSDLDCRDYAHRPEADGLECPPGRPCVPASSVLRSDDIGSGGGGSGGGCGGGGCGGGVGCGGGGSGGAGRVNYESFLEVTGLSQKSIVTVQSCNNRNMYGSHRNVQKPKDVKSRSRAKSTSFEYKPYPATVKYWTGPYL